VAGSKFDGNTWSIVPSPSPDTQFNELRGVAAVSANDAWAQRLGSGPRQGHLHEPDVRDDTALGRRYPARS